MSPRNEDFLFAQEAQNKGYVTEDQVEEAFLLQKRMAEELKIDERLAVILVKRGWMAEDQARRVYALLEPEGKRVQIEGYKLVERVGRGSMGTVYKAVHLGLHRVVAIKVLRRELLGEKVHTERLRNEARMLAELEHPNIVRALDAGESNGFPYVVMEYVEGETLKDRIARLGPLDEDEALRIGRGIADALEKARRMGVVHRDVKPGNILISTKGVPKLMDLGLAKGPVDMELTQHGATVGTPQFMAPEQVEEAGAVDCRSDIYGLGATMYAILTGRPPFTAPRMAEILNKVLNEQPMPIRARNSDVSPEVSYLVERMMLKDPSLRYQVPAEVVEHVDRIIGGQSIIPDGFKGNWEGYLLKERLKKRNRRLTIAGIVLVIASVGGYFTYSHTQRTMARSDADSVLEQIDTQSADNANMTREDLGSKIVLIRRMRQELAKLRKKGGLRERVPEVDARLQFLERFQKRWTEYDVLAVEADRLVAAQRFGTAHEKLGNFRETVTRFRALHRVIGEKQSAVAAESAIAVTRLVRQARDVAASDVAAYAQRFRLLSDQLTNGDFVERPQAPSGTSPLERSRRQLAALAGQLEAVQTAVAAFEVAYADKTMDDSIRGGTSAHSLREELTARVSAIKRSALTNLNPETWSEGFRREAVIDLVEGQLADRVSRYDRLVREWGTAVLEKARDLVGKQDYKKAVAALDPLLSSLRATHYRDLDIPAGELHDAAKAKIAEITAQRGVITLTAAQQVSLRLKRGDLDLAERAIREALAEKAAEEAAVRADLEALRHGIKAVEAVWTASLGYLAGPGKDVVHRNVAVYDDAWRTDRDGPIERVRIGSVDPAGYRLALRVYVGGKYVDREFEARQFPFRQHLVWARAGQASGVQPLQDIHVSLVQLFDDVAPDWRTIPDLRPVIKLLDRVRGVFRDAPGFRVWNEFAASAHTLSYQTHHSLREPRSLRVRHKARGYHLDRDFVPALDLYRQWLEPDAMWHFTNDFDENEERVRGWLAECEAEAAKREIETWLKGFRARDLSNGHTRLRCNFDIPMCLDNFTRGYGRLVSEAGSVVTTPSGTAEGKASFELLSGVDGLLRGRPLALPCMFDPADAIEMSFDLDTRQGAFFLALDIDGVQIGILSADPNWVPSWKLPKSVLAEGEPDVDFYGRGRGIAWHAGRDFGYDPSDPTRSRWNWLARQRGRNHPAWNKMGEGRDRLFAFKPGHQYRVKLIRTRDRVALFQADLRRFRALGDRAFEEVFTERQSKWRGVGTDSEVARGEMRHGSGLLQILSWSTVRIDNLELIGRVRDAWRDEQRREQKRARERAERESKEKK